MIQMAYLSSTPRLLTPDDIAQILLSSREKNTAKSITGILVYKDGNVLQVLEGGESEVTDLFERIKKDSRHRGVIQIYRKSIEARDFPDWSMGFRDLNAEGATYLEGYSEVLDPNFDLGNVKSKDAARLIRLFKSRPT
ncbi:MAG TPA: BLUF domain-containing protein [Opitutaceae bacterium]|nr:BLUF domain-containing protein [Opitutaceae bacterium]